MQAYKDAGFAPTAAKAVAYRLLDNVGIASRIADLQSKSAEKVALTLEEKHRFLREVVESPAGKIDENSPLCQGVKRNSKGKVTEIRTPDKLRALELSAKLAGELKGGEPTVILNNATQINVAVLAPSELAAIQARRVAALEARRA
jgi:phage terminase small subunit